MRKDLLELGFHSIWKGHSTYQHPLYRLVMVRFPYYIFCTIVLLRKIWRYQRGSNFLQAIIRRRTNNTLVKRKKDNRTNINLQNTAQKSKDQTTRTPLKTGSELRCSGRVSTSDNHCVTLVTNLMINCEWGQDRVVFMKSGTYPWSFVTQIFCNS